MTTPFGKQLRDKIQSLYAPTVQKQSSTYGVGQGAGGAERVIESEKPVSPAPTPSPIVSAAQDFAPAPVKEPGGFAGTSPIEPEQPAAPVVPDAAAQQQQAAAQAAAAQEAAAAQAAALAQQKAAQEAAAAQAAQAAQTVQSPPTPAPATPNPTLAEVAYPDVYAELMQRQQEREYRRQQLLAWKLGRDEFEFMS